MDNIIEGNCDVILNNRVIIKEIFVFCKVYAEMREKMAQMSLSGQNGRFFSVWNAGNTEKIKAILQRMKNGKPGMMQANQIGDMCRKWEWFSPNLWLDWLER